MVQAPKFHCLVTLATLLLCLSVTEADLEPRCGDCWCSFYGEYNECPAETGISDSFPQSWSVYNTFNLTNPDASYLKLQTEDEEPCYPWNNTLGAKEGDEHRSLPQCSIPQNTNTTVCAYKFENGTPCQNRNYEILNYASSEAAEADGAVVTHEGACGVCSTAQDLWARMNSLDDFEDITLLCAVSYTINRDFDRLVQCAQNQGLSYECALLWAHYGVATATECRSNCSSPESALNGPAPQCEPGSCVVCAQVWSYFFRDMAGRTMERSGITENTAKSCSAFARIEHDPCVGASTTVDDTTPTQSPGSGASMRGWTSPVQGAFLAGLVGYFWM